MYVCPRVSLNLGNSLEGSRSGGSAWVLSVG